MVWACGNLFPECDFETLIVMCMFVTGEHECALIHGSGCPVSKFPECDFESLIFMCMFVIHEHGVCAQSEIRLPFFPEEVVPTDDAA